MTGERRYLFRGDLLVASGDDTTVFEAERHLGDRMLTHELLILDSQLPMWLSYRYVMFDQGCGWSPLPDEDTARLRALLLIQQ